MKKVFENRVNVMTKKELIVFKLDTFILCTSIASLNYIGGDSNKIWSNNIFGYVIPFVGGS